MRKLMALGMLSLVAVLPACSKSGAESADQEALGCKRSWQGSDSCDFTVPEDLQAKDVYVTAWLISTAKDHATLLATSDSQPDNGTCVGGGQCAVVIKAAAGDEVHCEINGGAGDWGCALHPGGPKPPKSVTQMGDGAGSMPTLPPIGGTGLEGTGGAGGSPSDTTPITAPAPPPPPPPPTPTFQSPGQPGQPGDPGEPGGLDS